MLIHFIHFLQSWRACSDNLRELTGKSDSELQDTRISWVRISRWLPWMKMGDRDGVVIYHTAGKRASNGYAELPEPLASELKKNYPIYLAPPPLDDTRPNETTWTVVKKAVDKKRAAKAAKK